MKQNSDSANTSVKKGKHQEFFRVPGITCGGCIRRVTTLLQTLPVQIDSVSVGQVTVSFEPGRVSRQQLLEALSKAGYPAH